MDVAHTESEVTMCGWVAVMGGNPGDWEGVVSQTLGGWEKVGEGVVGEEVGGDACANCSSKDTGADFYGLWNRRLLS